MSSDAFVAKILKEGYWFKLDKALVKESIIEIPWADPVKTLKQMNTVSEIANVGRSGPSIVIVHGQ